MSQAAYESQLMDERSSAIAPSASVLVQGDTSGRAADPAVVAFHFDRAERVTDAVTQYLAAATQAQASAPSPKS